MPWITGKDMSFYAKNYIYIFSSCVVLLLMVRLDVLCMCVYVSVVVLYVRDCMGVRH